MGPRAQRAQPFARVHVRRAQRGQVLRGAGALTVLVAVATLLFVSFGQKPMLAPTRALATVASAAIEIPKTTFIDGSVARVSDGGELVVKVATADHIESVLTAGAADFEVTKHPERDFVVLAGPVRVRVVGTHFRVERSGERTRVSVTEGKVEVQEGELRSYLEAGESRFFRTHDAGRQRGGGARQLRR